MLRAHWLIAVGLIACSLEVPAAFAQDPAFGFLYGYGLGQGQRFRNQLPTPPYFSIYPPVYYGKRYERPYGDSPFASWPTLQPNATYRPEARREANPGMLNPYCPDCTQYSNGEEVLPTMTSNAIALGKKVVIENPFFTNDANESEIAKTSLAHRSR